MAHRSHRTAALPTRGSLPTPPRATAPSRLSRPWSALVAAALATTPGAWAADRIWDGNGGDDRWSFSAGVSGNTNWTHPTPFGGPVLGSGDRLFFDGTLRTSNRNDVTGLNVAGLVFKPGAGRFVLGGEALTVSGDILNQSAQLQTLGFARLQVGDRQTWDGGTAGITVADFALGDQALTLRGPVNAAASGTLMVGLHGTGSLVAGSGSRLQLEQLRLGNGAAARGTLRMDGGELSASDQIYVGTSGQGTMHLGAGARVSSVGGHVGRFAGALGEVVIQDHGRWTSQSGQTLQLGYQGRGEVRVQTGGVLDAHTLGLGALAGGSGTLAIGDGGRVVTHRLDLGGQGQGLIQVQPGGELVGDRITLRPGGELQLAGGRLELLYEWDSTGPGGVVNFEGGRLAWTAGELALPRLSLGAGADWGPAMRVPEGGRLDVEGMVHLPAGSVLQLGADATLRSGRVELAGGLLLAGSLDVDAVGVLSGTGRVDARIHGGAAGGRIEAQRISTQSGLTIGRADSGLGVDFDGATQIRQNADLTLLDADQARLGGGLSLAPGSVLRAPNGLLLDGGSVSVVNYAEIRGDVALRGNGVSLNTSASQSPSQTRLVMFGTVSGSATFGGDGRVVFGDRVAPGGTGIGSLVFGQVGAEFQRDSILALDVREHDGHDRFGGANSGLWIDGAWLLLEFSGSFAAGATLDLLDFGSRQGEFSVGVRGIDAGRLDLSRLHLDGSISIAALSPVPEPGAGLMLAGGLAGLAWYRRRLRAGEDPVTARRGSA
jgi:T5SS/PEP-CTERM-associated repeat protein